MIESRIESTPEPQVGDTVTMTCYKKGCEEVAIIVTLGQEYRIYSDFVRLGGVGRIHWDRETVKIRDFDLWERRGGSGHCDCPNCRTLFASALAVLELGKEPLFFGYEADPDHDGEVAIGENPVK